MNNNITQLNHLQSLNTISLFIWNLSLY